MSNMIENIEGLKGICGMGDYEVSYTCDDPIEKDENISLTCWIDDNIYVENFPEVVDDIKIQYEGYDEGVLLIALRFNADFTDNVKDDVCTSMWKVLSKAKRTKPSYL